MGKKSFDVPVYFHFEIIYKLMCMTKLLDGILDALK
jgi:hypothetical protein